MLSRLKRALFGWAKRKPTSTSGFEPAGLAADGRLQRLDDIDARFGRWPNREIELRLLQVGFVTSSDFVAQRRQNPSKSES